MSLSFRGEGGRAQSADACGSMLVKTSRESDGEEQDDIVWDLPLNLLGMARLGNAEPQKERCCPVLSKHGT